MGWLIFIAVVIWIFSQSKNSKKLAVPSKDRIKFDEERMSRFSDRFIDDKLSLFDRNKDVIDSFLSKVKAETPSTSYSYGNRYSNHNYYFDNLTRDCVNDICIAENNFSEYPDTSWLSDWKPKAQKSWLELAGQIEGVFRERQKFLQEEKRHLDAQRDAEGKVLAEKEKLLRIEKWEKEETIKQLERNIKRYRSEFSKEKEEYEDPSANQKIRNRKEKGDFFIEEISEILAQNLHTWSETEEDLIMKLNIRKPFPLFHYDAPLTSFEQGYPIHQMNPPRCKHTGYPLRLI